MQSNTINKNNNKSKRMKTIFSILFLLSWSCIFAQTPPFTVEAFYSKPDEVTVYIHNHSDREMRIWKADFILDNSHSYKLPMNDSMRVWIKIPSQMCYQTNLPVKEKGLPNGVLSIKYTFQYVVPPAGFVEKESIIRLKVMPSPLDKIGNVLTVPAERLEGDTVYQHPDIPPHYPGGDKALLGCIHENVLRYTSEVWERTGCEIFRYKVYVRFIVEEDGSISHIYPFIGTGTFDGDIVSGRRAIFDIANSLTHFTPGRVKGKVVRSFYTIPILFRSY